MTNVTPKRMPLTSTQNFIYSAPCFFYVTGSWTSIFRSKVIRSASAVSCKHNFIIFWWRLANRLSLSPQKINNYFLHHKIRLKSYQRRSKDFYVYFDSMRFAKLDMFDIGGVCMKIHYEHRKYILVWSVWYLYLTSFQS